MNYISQAQFEESFIQAGVTRGDVLMLHADAMVLAQLPPMPTELRFQCLFDVLDSVLGPDGTLVMPTFTYSLTKGECFDPDNTPSTVGTLTEYFRKMPNVFRSSEPIFSMAAKGRLAKEFANVPVDDSFGPHSAFGLLNNYNANLICLGCGFDRITYTHYVEQKIQVDYRYFKTFDGTIIRHGITEPIQTRYFVRDFARESVTNLSSLQTRLSKNGLLNMIPVGRVALYAVRCHAFEEQARQLIAERSNALIVEGNK